MQRLKTFSFLRMKVDKYVWKLMAAWRWDSLFPRQCGNSLSRRSSIFQNGMAPYLSRQDQESLVPETSREIYISKTVFLIGSDIRMISKKLVTFYTLFFLNQQGNLENGQVGNLEATQRPSFNGWTSWFISEVWFFFFLKSIIMKIVTVSLGQPRFKTEVLKT